MEDRLTELERRLARTERRARLTLAMGLLALVGAVMLLAAKPALTQTHGTTVKAPHQVVNDQGKLLMEVRNNELWLVGPGGIRDELGWDASRSFLFLNGRMEPGQSTPGAGVSLEAFDDGARLRLRDGQGQLAASLAINVKNRLFVLYDKDGNPIFRGGYGGMERRQTVGSIAPGAGRQRS